PALAKIYTFWKASDPATGSFVSITPHNAHAGRFWKGFSSLLGPDGPDDRPQPNAEVLRDLWEAEALLSELQGSPSVKYSLWSPKPFALAPGIGHAGCNPLPDQLPLKLGNRGQDVQHEPC